jgi:hypothetical protein
MSSKQSYLPSADLLLKQYIRLAQQFTDAATPQVGAHLCTCKLQGATGK